MVTIQKKLIKYNYTANANTPTHIVIHDTGNKSNGANAEMHYKYFNGGDRNASAHFFVDDHSIIQTVEIKDKSWHCGDGKGAYGITNGNSIGVEICVNADGNYGTAVQNAVDLAVYLMKTYKIGIDKVVRHYDASRKLCPASMSASNWAKWTEFKSKVATALNPPAPVTTDKYTVKAGDTFIAIAAKFKLTVDELKALNPHIKNPAVLQIGDILNLKKSEEAKPVNPVDIYANVPDWVKETVKKCKEKGYLTDPNGDDTFYRILKVLENMGLIK